METIKRYSWPGNLREFENVVARLTILHSGKSITEKETSTMLKTAPSQSFFEQETD